MNIDYGDLTFSERRKLDHDAFINYYNSCFEGDTSVRMRSVPLTFNNWYGTESHKKYATALLRKLKIEKIKKQIN